MCWCVYVVCLFGCLLGGLVCGFVFVFNIVFILVRELTFFCREFPLFLWFHAPRFLLLGFLFQMRYVETNQYYDIYLNSEI